VTVQIDFPSTVEIGSLVEVRGWRRYPAYEDSGIPWLGEVPAHWDIAPIYARYTVQLGKMLNPDAVQGTASAPYLRNTNVQWDRVDLNDLQQMDFSPDERRKFELRPDDLLVCEGGEVGRTAIWRGQLDACFFQKAVHRVRPIRDSDAPRFLYYLLYAAAHRGVFEAEGNRSTIVHLTAEKLRHHRFPFPDLAEQRRIVALLNEETAKIDALIEKKRQLVGLIEEKRAALLSHAVSKGLDPDAPMKDSRVEWLGQVPAHWEVKRLKFCLRRIEQGWCPPSETRPAEPGEWAILKAGAANGGTFRPEEHKALVPNVQPLIEYAIRAGDFIVSRANTRELLGSAALVQQDYPYLLLCDKLYRLKLLACSISPHFLVRLLASRYARFQLEREATGASDSMQNIQQGTLRELVVACPPVFEQRAIIEHLDREAAQLDALAAKIRRHVELLDEYRTALISAAVTGKIDVREA
jgi:type I restriction enzyme, S subunit